MQDVLLTACSCPADDPDLLATFDAESDPLEYRRQASSVAHDDRVHLDSSLLRPFFRRLRQRDLVGGFLVEFVGGVFGDTLDTVQVILHTTQKPSKRRMAVEEARSATYLDFSGLTEWI